MVDDQQPTPGSTAAAALRRWLYVLNGKLRLVLGDHDVEIAPGEVAEFDTDVPHALGSADGRPVELLIIFGRQGERAHVRARSRPSGGS